MQKYIGTKVILAKPMTRGDYNLYRGWTIPADENPADEGYLVKYSDDYESWSPKEQFERAYRSFDGGMPFGSALDLLKMGYKLTRRGWNGKNMCIYMQEGSAVDFKELKPELQEKLSDIPCINVSDGLIHICPHIDMKAADGSIVIGWLASQTDMLAEDWIVVE